MSDSQDSKLRPALIGGASALILSWVSWMAQGAVDNVAARERLEMHEHMEMHPGSRRVERIVERTAVTVEALAKEVETHRGEIRDLQRATASRE